MEKNDKKELLNYLKELVDTKVSEAKQSIVLLNEAKEKETKSSAGDKFEIAREMIQTEITKAEEHLSKVESQKVYLSNINFDGDTSSVKVGTLVETNFATFLISIALGKVQLNGKEYFAISLSSPIGKALYDKKVGEKILFNGREYLIKSIV